MPDVFPIGVYYGSSKPCDTNFLKVFVNEARELAEEGFTLPGCDIVFRAKIVCFICDAPARAFVKQDPYARRK
jgi:hypothetical protein